MEQNPRISQKLLSHFSMMCVLFCILVVHLNVLAAATDVFEENLSSLKALEVIEKKHKAALKKRLPVLLDESAQKCLNQLLAISGTLDEVLSSQPYLTYLEARFGNVYEDYSTYLAAMPTAKLKTEALFTFKDVILSKQTSEELQTWIKYYFQMRQFYAVPDILNDRQKFMATEMRIKSQLLMTFGISLTTIAETETTMTKAEKMALLAKVDKILDRSRIFGRLASVDTKVYHAFWSDRLEKYGSDEGLLRCAIATPADFALTRSFFENPQVLKKWILTPLKKSVSATEKEE